jgi:tetratricopeptide (TPR) repeat protein
MRLCRSIALGLVLASMSATSVAANPRSEALRRDATDAAYNLNYERAMDLYGQAIAADPNDAAAYRGAASACWLRVLFLRGTVLVEDYLGHLRASGNVPMPPPPPAIDTAFHQYIGRAVALAEKEVDRRYRDASSHYDLGAALGIDASYTGTVEGHIFDAMRLARRAYSESEMALELDPRMAAAGLVAGTYRYMVSTLPAPVRVMAYVVGFGGGREEGIRLIEHAATGSSDTRTEAKFALVLIDNREHRYSDAVAVIRDLARAYPQNRLLVLEEGSTLLRGNRAAEADKVLEDGMARLAQDPRPRMRGEEGRWLFKRGTARLRIGRLDGADADLRAALSAKDVPEWVLARIHVELGNLADVRGDRTAAVREYRTALAVASAARDGEAESRATQYLAQAYKQ